MLQSKVKNGSQECKRVYGVAPLPQSRIVFSDIDKFQIKSTDQDGIVSVIAGSGESCRRYGVGTRAAFGQPFAVCTEIETIFVADPAVSSVCMISGPAPLVSYLQKMGELYDVFSMRTKKQYSLEEGLEVLESVLCYFKNVSEKLRNTFKLQGTMQGPEGVICSNILLSIEMMITYLKSILQEFPERRQKFVMKAFTTLVNELFFSRVRQECLTPETLDFAQIFPSIVTELIKRITKLPFLFFHSSSFIL